MSTKKEPKNRKKKHKLITKGHGNEPTVIEFNLSKAVILLIIIGVVIAGLVTKEIVTTIIKARQNKVLAEEATSSENAVYVQSSDEIQVPVPKGYVASQIPGETSVNGGFVIYEDNYNGQPIDWNSILVETNSLSANSLNASNAINSTTPQATTDYTLTTESAVRPSNNQEVSFRIDFVYANIKGYDKVIIEYDTRIKIDESIFEGGNIEIKNDAYLDYSNNPYKDEDDYEEGEDEWQTNGPEDGEDSDSTVKIYTYGAIIQNKDKSGKLIENGGAEFTLSLGGNAQYFKKTSDGVYFLVNSTDSDGGAPTQTLVVGADGTLKIYGLATENYTLTQTKAPKGYNKASSTAAINIVDAEPEQKNINYYIYVLV